MTDRAQVFLSKWSAGGKKEKRNPPRCPLLIKVIDRARRTQIWCPGPNPPPPLAEQQSCNLKKKLKTVRLDHFHLSQPLSNWSFRCATAESSREQTAVPLSLERDLCSCSRSHGLFFFRCACFWSSSKEVQNAGMICHCSGFVSPSLCSHLRAQKVYALYTRAQRLQLM